MTLLRIFLAVVAFCVAAWTPLAAQSTLTLSQQDMEAAQYWFSNYPGYGESLYDAPIAFPDGARGFELLSFVDHAMEVGPIQPHDAQSEIRAQYCNSRLVAIAHATDHTTVLASNKKAIFSVTRFTIERVLRKDGHLKSGDQITTIEFGGTFRDDKGVLLRVEFKGDTSFAKGKSYLLYLRKVHNATTYFPEAERIEIANGRLFSKGRLGDTMIPTTIKPGETFDEYWKAFLDDFHAHGCYEYKDNNYFNDLPN